MEIHNTAEYLANLGSLLGSVELRSRGVYNRFAGLRGKIMDVFTESSNDCCEFGTNKLTTVCRCAIMISV